VGDVRLEINSSKIACVKFEENDILKNMHCILKDEGGGNSFSFKKGREKKRNSWAVRIT